MVSWYCQFLLSGLRRTAQKIYINGGYFFNALKLEKQRVETLPVCFHDLVHFIDFTVEAASSYESGQFPENDRRFSSSCKSEWSTFL